MPKPNVMVHEMSNSGREGLQRKTSKDFDPNDPLRMFLRGTETRQLLTVKEETELIAHIQVYLWLYHSSIEISVDQKTDAYHCIVISGFDEIRGGKE